MLRSTLAAAALLCLFGLPVEAAPPDKAPPPAPFRKVSELVKLPDFLPGMGTLYVDPKTLPAGPFLAYDHDGRLVSTIYMIPSKDFDEHKKFSGLGAEDAKVDHVDIVLWHVPKADEATVAK
jgi:hypothetical protein